MSHFPRWLWRAGCFAAAFSFLATTVSRAAEPAPGLDPVRHWEFDFESGLLWRAGHNATPLNYIVQPNLLTLKSPAVFECTIGGSFLVIRSRYALVIEPILKGPENHFFGAIGSGMLEWWDAKRTRALFFSSGGGIGLLDSKGYVVKGAQGQDFNLTWLLYLGGRFRLQDGVSASFGAYYQHVSNGGMNKVNPGLDAVGPMLSVGWHF